MVTYRIEFFNSGNIVATNSYLEDILPIGQVLTGSITYNDSANFTGFVQS
jgi:uncharacterized repeat protein (TIGR01451 family)